ncbi:MAG: cadmium-translocating P-type ATPase, partial [Chloroflexota bacterium]|nr:cadmium-translocating P-type ATPase [Chloroflexota bacterium]
HVNHAGHDEPANHAEPAGHDKHAKHAEHAGHDKHAGHDPEVFRRQFWIVLLLTVPVVIWSMSVQEILGYTAPTFPGSELIPAALGTLVFLIGGRVFLVGARDELAMRQPGMMTLISLAIVVAFVASLAATLGVFEVEVWWELATLITIMSLGHWLEMRAIAQARGALDALAALLPDTAERVSDTGSVEAVPVASLRVGEVVLVRPGGRVPVDGTVTDGRAEVDESMITGESRPIDKEAGDRVVAGTVTAGGSLRVRVDAVGDETALSGIMRMVAAAQASGSRAQALADRAAALLFYVAVAAAAVTLVAWMVAGRPEDALVRVATVLVIACPHALGLAIPLVISISTSLGARNGLLVKDRLALERARDLDVVIFDKTGTLTRGRPAVTAVEAVGGMTDDELLSIAASVEADSEHPLARAIERAADERGVARRPVSDFEARPGRGVRGVVDGRDVTVGGPRLLADAGLEPTDGMRGWAVDGATVLSVLADGRLIGSLAIADEIRPESREAVRSLRALGVRVAMITGDARSVAEAVARSLEIDPAEVAAEVLPADKDAAVARFQADGSRVAMVGDGVNDAPALARADVGIAIGAGTDVAVESAGIVLASDDPRDVVGAIRLSRAAYRKMVQNLWWAAGYNIVAIPLAAGVLAPIGFVMPMSVGALLMSVSTIVVAANAQLLRGLRLREERPPTPAGGSVLTAAGG